MTARAPSSVPGTSPTSNLVGPGGSTLHERLAATSGSKTRGSNTPNSPGLTSPCRTGFHGPLLRVAFRITHSPTRAVGRIDTVTMDANPAAGTYTYPSRAKLSPGTTLALSTSPTENSFRGRPVPGAGGGDFSLASSCSVVATSSSNNPKKSCASHAIPGFHEDQRPARHSPRLSTSPGSSNQ